MEDTCPNFNVDNALEETLTKMPGIAQLLDKLKEDKSVFSDECPVLDNSSVGGKRKKNRSHNSKKSKSRKSGRKLMGGSLSALQIKRSIQFAMLVIFVYMTATSNSSVAGIQSGLMAIWSGECSNMSNRLWGMLGLSNPVCASYNQLMTIIYRAVVGDLTAVSTLTGMVGLVAAMPFLANSTLRIGTYYIASKLPLQVMPREELEKLRQDAFGAVREIEDAQGQLPQDQRSKLGSFFTNSMGVNPLIENSSESQDGGKRVKKSKKSKKNKTMKSKKSKKLHKSKKARKSKKAKRV